MQGDLEDWQHESTLMGAVYANSSLNIAAADSLDSNTGCFFDRNPPGIYGCKVKATKDKEGLSESIWDVMPEYYALQMISDCPLASRAWVFQERFLAPRTLYFRASELVWECRKSFTSEIFPDSFDNQVLTTPGLSKYWIRGKRGSVAESWSLIIPGFSPGNRTFGSDKLVALSGISRLFATKFAASYIAGLWREELELQLVWYVTCGLTARPKAYRAPTWSWAAIDGDIFQEPTYDGSNMRLYLSIEDVAVKPMIEDQFG
ncbi:hypothetical protein G7Y89_g4916 [Cudoniella acicularis]|uniref:Heterokaryon incompatibility domain-containing protein n=1 Tax=Cudoniella acicularis TaxID=354080 RepID=A0A8H4W677_9HELO|nr:hypothetical protein G7Y89_g4916 [Cudoniella acicularis]